MKGFCDYNPITQFIYFTAVTGITMFCANPVITAFSLVFALLFFLLTDNSHAKLSHLYTLLLFLVTALINPLFYHNGATVLFVFNNNPITLEATLYGFSMAVMLCAVLYWFRSFSLIMKSERLLYLLGKLSPKAALLLSMTLRYIPLFTKQAQKINQAQQALGLYKEDNIIDSVRGKLRILSVMTTWALENGIVTADSMTARGYGIGQRTHFSLFTFTAADALFIIIAVLLTLLSLWGSGAFVYYPLISAPPLNIKTLTAYTAYTLLAALPTLTEIEERIKWKYLKSKI